MFTFSGRREQARSPGGNADHVQYIIPGKGRTTRCGIVTLSIGLGIGLLANACLIFFYTRGMVLLLLLFTNLRVS